MAVLNLSESLVAGNADAGVLLSSATAVIKGVVVRDTVESKSGKPNGGGIIATLYVGSTLGSDLTLSDSLVRANRFVGVGVGSSKAKISKTVVSATRPTTMAFSTDGGHNMTRGGIGIQVSSDIGGKVGSDVTISSSLISGNRTVGLAVGGSTAKISGSIVSDTMADEHTSKNGIGVSIAAGETTGQVSKVTLEDCLVTKNRKEGIRVLSSTTTMDRCIVRDTRSQKLDSAYGVGLMVAAQLQVAKPSQVTVNDSIVERNTSIGVAVLHSSATLNRTVVKGTAPSDVDQRFGTGVYVHTESKKLSSAATLKDCTLDKNSSAGVQVNNGSLTLERVQILGTLAEKKTGQYGDGVFAAPRSGWTSFVQISDSLIKQSSRAGVLLNGAGGAIRRSVMRQGSYSIVLGAGATPTIAEDNVYEQNKRDNVSFGVSLDSPPLPKVPTY